VSGSEAPRLAEPADFAAVLDGLRALADDLGDPFAISEAGLQSALFGSQPLALAIVAGGQGVALAQPQISTSAGGFLAYVSDLWVARPARGTGLGRQLLAVVAREGSSRWGVLGLRLVVYDGNTNARAVYDRLGFVTRDRDRVALLVGARFEQLKDTP
jgi:ribosomal protein S18 acetylase RimI-like enzyme